MIEIGFRCRTIELIGNGQRIIGFLEAFFNILKYFKRGEIYTGFLFRQQSIGSSRKTCKFSSDQTGHISLYRAFRCKCRIKKEQSRLKKV